MRVVLNHLTIGLIYRGFWKMGPALVGTLVSLLYQLINLYGFLPAVLMILIASALIGAGMSVSIFILSLFFIPLHLCMIISLIIIAVAILSWLFINISVNSKAKLRIFKLNYSSRMVFLMLSVLLCNRLVPIKISARTSFWDVHFKPSLAGKIGSYDFATLNKLIGEDLRRMKQVLGEDTVLFGCTPGSLAEHFSSLPDKYDYQIVKTVIPPEHAQVFGLIRDFNLHIVNL
ncbi:MAG: hypothetical protein GX790_02120 [Syntrophomonadaceae bacterium]|nr:hypothetical protein [Syntrophomonadaceae bacterium]